MARIRTHGITRKPAEMENIKPQPWEYEQIELGLNYRMSEIQAALGISQLNRLDKFIARRRQLAMQYDELLSELTADSSKIFNLKASLLGTFILY